MATLTLLPNGDVIFNVDHSVGKYGRNHSRADAQLVQYLLNLIIAHPAFYRDVPDLPLPQPLVTNGISTHQTNETILWFQKASNSIFNGVARLAEDATINHAGSPYYGKDYKQYTIYMLNWYLGVGGNLPLRVEDILLQPLRSDLEKGLKKSGHRVSYIARP